MRAALRLGGLALAILTMGAGCAAIAPRTAPVTPAAAPSMAGEPPSAANVAATAPDSAGHRAMGIAGTATVVPEAWLSAMDEKDNIDSPASWQAPDGSVWVFATAKKTDKLVMYDGETGKTLGEIGRTGEALGEFRRPNGVAVIDDLLFVVERDNHRVQAFRLPSLEPIVIFGAADLVKPYGLYITRKGKGYDLYVTDSYEAADESVPPLKELGKRVKRYRVEVAGDALAPKFVANIGDTKPEGALRIVESIWGDPANDRLMIAEEDETYANEIKVYDMAGRYTGKRMGRGDIAAQAEGVSLRTCGTKGGYWVTTEQAKDRSVFHLFDRVTLKHVGKFSGAKVANTDGIWVQPQVTTKFPAGALYAVHDDQGVVAFDWRDVDRALGLPACAAGG